MADRHYHKELSQLKELGARFGAAHPALAAMLAGPSRDPDVERLLEGVAFQTALLHHKLEEDLPDLAFELARLLIPHYVQAVPASTIVAFSPKESLTRSATVPKGSQLASVPAEGTRCLFRTCSEVELHPVDLTEATLAGPADAPSLTLSFVLHALPLDQWSPNSLRLFMGGEPAAAADLYLLLRRHVVRIVIVEERGGKTTVLPKGCLRPAQFAQQEAIIPYPPQAFPGYRLLQEYFTIPQRFLFLDVTGWERWRERGSGSKFSLRFELSPFALRPPKVTRESFILHAAPAVNLFAHDAAPVRLDHRSERYLLRPDGLRPEHAQIVSVDRVTGLVAGGGRVERNYHPFELFRKVTSAAPAYHTTMAQSPLHRGVEVHLSVAHPKEAGLPEAETLSVGLTCSNGYLPERLRIGDLCESTGSSPGFATFCNITPFSPMLLPPLGNELLWRLAAHLSLDTSSLAKDGSLQALLALYLPSGAKGCAALAANRRRIAGIDEVGAVPTERLVRGLPIRGHHVTVRIRGDHFAGSGDIFLFGSVLAEFLASRCCFNSFTELTVHEVLQGETFQWQINPGS